MSTSIRDTVIGPSHPGAHYALVTMALGLELTADRVLFPQGALTENPQLLAGVVKLARKYVRLHAGETVHVLSRPDQVQTMAHVLAEIQRNGVGPGMAVRAEFRELPLLDMEASHTLWVCGDGRPWYWQSLVRIFQYFGSPRIITPPGEMQWMRDHPEIAGQLQTWIDRQPPVPNVVVKHATCGYRKFKGTPQEEKAWVLEHECTDPNTLYLWQQGEGTVWFETLRERQT